jgi:flagellin-specific chaperone FliS
MTEEPNDYKWSSYKDYIKTNTIISNSQKEFILACYNNINQFMKFHREVDNNEYLDTKEDLEGYRIEKAQEIISTYLDEYKMKEIGELKVDLVSLTEVISQLLNKSGLSHRQIAKLLNISNNVVHKVNLECN